MEKNYLGIHETVASIRHYFFALLFPNYYHVPNIQITDEALEEKIHEAIAFVIEEQDAIDDLSKQVMVALPHMKELIMTDVSAAYDGDPAATSEDEIILAYPGFKAISIHRLAHAMYQLSIPIIPRLLSETAHSETGIDIHPGASIGPYFFIDHGTGIIVGETTVIGQHVSLYQSVTLGVRRFKKAEDGTLLKGGKRHPTIGDNVTIYAGATVLGGDTFIGDGAVIGSGAWVKASVPPNTWLLKE